MAGSDTDDALAWGTASELTALETLMWRADVDPTMRSTVMAIEILDVEPEWGRLVAAHQWASRMVPRFRDRVVEPLGVLGAPLWSRDPELDLHYHLRRIRLGGDASYAELFGFAEKLAMTPFDRARPPWESVLVEGLPEGKAAYVLKLHHALTDGLGLTQLLGQIHSRQRAHQADKPQPDLATVQEQSLAQHVSRQLRSDASAIPAIVRGGFTALKGLHRPHELARGAARYLRSAQRVLSPSDTPGLPLLAARSASWRFVALDVDFADLRAASKAAGGSLNDAFTAALVGAFRIYHEEIGAALPEDALMPVAVPVSVRKDDDDAGGNRFAAARLAGPVGLTDPAARIQLIGRSMARARSEPALESADFVAPVLARLPGNLLVRLAGATTSGNDLQASNVPGVREEMFLAGARIERIYPFAPLPGCAAMITLHTYRGVCCVGANLDAAAISDVNLFGRCLRAGFAEVLSLNSVAAQPLLVE